MAEQKSSHGKIGAKRVLLSAPRFEVIELSHETPDGKSRKRQVVKHPGSCAVLPIIDSNLVCLIENYRPAVERWVLEIPAGTLERGELPIENAHRELLEETGYRAGKMEKIHSLAMSPGILDEQIHLFIARDLTYQSPQREAGELIRNRIVSISEIDRLIRDRKIEDAKTLTALLWFLRYREHA